MPAKRSGYGRAARPEDAAGECCSIARCFSDNAKLAFDVFNDGFLRENYCGHDSASPAIRCTSALMMRQAGVESADRLARCAESKAASKAVIERFKDQQIAEFRGRVLETIRVRLVELRAGARSEVETSRYERLSVESLIEGYGLDSVLIGRSEVPAGIEGRRFAVEGRLQTSNSETEDFERRTEPKFSLWPATFEHENPAAGVDETPGFSIIEADIGDLTRSERAFARDVCEFFYARLAYDAMGCPMVAYGRVVFESLGGLLAEDAVGLLEPIFRIEAVEFQDPPQP